MNERFRKDADALLSGLTWRREDARAVLAQVKGERPRMKQKMRLSLVFAMVLVLAAGAALAFGLRYSDQMTVTLSARQALMEQRGMTQDMVRMFSHEHTTEQDGKTVTTYSAPGRTTFSDGEAMGTYTVTRDADGQTTVSWSHDDVDPATWQNADVTSAIWGPPQLQQVLDRYAAYRAWHERNRNVYTLPLEEQEPLFAELRAAIAPLVTQEGPIDPAIANREEEATAPEPPAEGVAEATELAKRVLYKRYALTDEMLTLFTIDAWQEEDVWGWSARPSAFKGWTTYPTGAGTTASAKRWAYTPSRWTRPPMR